MFHLRLIKGLSYDGAVRASVGAPDVFTDDPEKYKAALESGYFKAIQDAPAATDESKGGEPENLKGHLDPAQLETMSEEALTKLAGEMGLDVAGLKTKEEVVAAISGEEVYAPVATDEDVDLSKMTVDKLREYAKENGISLTGCGTKSEILQKINEFEADARAAAEVLQQSGDDPQNN